jgi:hypothetical protein
VFATVSPTWIQPAPPIIVPPVTLAEATCVVNVWQKLVSLIAEASVVVVTGPPMRIGKPPVVFEPIASQ